jgi:hypothetical protein
LEIKKKIKAPVTNNRANEPIIIFEGGVAAMRSRPLVICSEKLKAIGRPHDQEVQLKLGGLIPVRLCKQEIGHYFPNYAQAALLRSFNFELRGSAYTFCQNHRGRGRYVLS